MPRCCCSTWRLKSDGGRGPSRKDRPVPSPPATIPRDRRPLYQGAIHHLDRSAPLIQLSMTHKLLYHWSTKGYDNRLRQFYELQNLT